MSVFEREMPRCRTAIINVGDTIQRIASRELGDGNRWNEIAWINSLRSPYIVELPGDRIEGTLAPGDFILIPSPVGPITSRHYNEDVLATDLDCSGNDRQLSLENGDLKLISGKANLRQQLRNKLNVPAGSLVRHSTFGTKIKQVLGMGNAPLAGNLAAEYSRNSLLSDFRVDAVSSVTSTITGDKIETRANVILINGEVFDTGEAN
ncbi:putative baseplate protein [Morganella phage Mecenats66]|nr:putative baseplate protein [Morganella phage Mecenats66]